LIRTLPTRDRAQSSVERERGGQDERSAQWHDDPGEDRPSITGLVCGDRRSPGGSRRGFRAAPHSERSSQRAGADPGAGRGGSGSSSGVDHFDATRLWSPGLLKLPPVRSGRDRGTSTDPIIRGGHNDTMRSAPMLPTVLTDSVDIAVRRTEDENMDEMKNRAA